MIFLSHIRLSLDVLERRLPRHAAIIVIYSFLKFIYEIKLKILNFVFKYRSPAYLIIDVNSQGKSTMTTFTHF